MEILKPYRAKIDVLDDQIIDLLGQRLAIIQEVAALKAENDIDPVLPSRVDEVRERCVERGVQKGYDADFIRDLYTRLIAYSCQVEEEAQNS